MTNNPNASLYPWTQRRFTFTTSHPNPFPRYGAAVNSVANKEGDVYMMGGLIHGSTVKGDLWLVEAGGGNLSCLPLATTSEGPGPRVGHASLIVGNAFIVYGGDTKMDDRDVLDDTLYLLNTCRLPFPFTSIIGEAPLTLASDTSLVESHTRRTSAVGSIRPHPQYHRLQNIHLRRSGGGLLLQRSGGI